MVSLNRLLSVAVVSLSLFTFYATAADVVDVEGEKAAKVGTADTVRITGTGIAGAEISVMVDGAGKLNATNDIRRIKNGQVVIGLSIKEFMIRPTMKGVINVTVTVKNPTSDKAIISKYKIVAE